MSNIKEKCRVAVDAMGGDFAPENPVLGAIDACSEDPGIEVILIGDSDKIKEVLKKHNKTFNSENIIHTDEIVGMHESPTSALKSKPNSSISVGAKLVKEGKADAFISAGNTGAMMAASTLLMGRIKGVSRPSIGTPLPTEKDGFSFVFDAGASVDCKPSHLLEYSILSTIYLEELYGIKSPSVGLLNVGEEESKGNELTKATYKLLKEAPINFAGNVEGRDILKGSVDIVICDGFIGNIILKFAESMMGLLKAKIRTYADKNIFNGLKVLSMKGTLKKSLTGMDYQEYGGVPLLGVNGISIIGHGSSSLLAMKNMVLRAKEMYQKQLIAKFRNKLDEYGQLKKNS